MVRLLNTADRAYLAAGAMLYVALISPPVLRLLESRMTTHMTVLLPGLALAGYLCGVRLRTLVAPMSQSWNAGGNPRTYRHSIHRSVLDAAASAR